jgi:hypothetical protein
MNGGCEVPKSVAPAFRSVLVLVAIILVASAVPAAASHRPNFYCSKSGDICQSTQKVDGKRKLRMATIEKYFDRFNLCVTAPDGSRRCEEFKMKKNGAVWSRSVRWSKQFPNKGPGAYTVVWKVDGSRVGKRLGFHRGG